MSKVGYHRMPFTKEEIKKIKKYAPSLSPIELHAKYFPYRSLATIRNYLSINNIPCKKRIYEKRKVFGVERRHKVIFKEQKKREYWPAVYSNPDWSKMYL